LENRGINDEISAFKWKTSIFDTSVGYVKMWEDSNYNGVKKILELSMVPENTVISIGDWSMNDEVSSMKWEHLGSNIEVEFYEHGDASGRAMTIGKWTGGDAFKSNLENREMDDEISAFKWKRRRTKCETDTELLMEQMHSKYNDAEKTETVLSTRQVVFVDFSTNSRYNTLYAAACAEGEGNYQELHYTATCTTTDLLEKLIVSGQVARSLIVHSWYRFGMLICCRLVRQRACSNVSAGVAGQGNPGRFLEH
jgi:hypothetical protein